MLVKTGPKADINSDHEYLDMGIYSSKYRKSRNDRRKYFKFPDYLLNNKDFMSLIEQKIKQRMDKLLSHELINRSTKYNRIRWKIYDNYISIGKNPDVVYLELLYEVVEEILDTAQLWQDWDRMDRFKKEKQIREDINNLKLSECKINSVKYNLEHQKLNRSLEEINRQKKDLRET